MSDPVKRATVVLAVTQIIGWGTTFYLPAILRTVIGQELGLPGPVVFGGVTLCVVITGLLSPALGKLFDRRGAAHFMGIGSVVMAASLIVLSQAQGLVSYALAWAGFGVGSALCLSLPTFTSLAQVAGDRARATMTLLMLFTGTASSVFWPIMGVLEPLVGWRMTCLVFAALHLCVCLPLHAFMLPRRVKAGAKGHKEPLKTVPPAIAEEASKATFLLMAFAFALSGFVSWGLSLHIVTILSRAGLSPATALAIGSALGALQVCGRLLDYFLGHRLTPAAVALVSAIVLPLSFIVLWAGLGSPVFTFGFVALYAVSTGLLGVIRSTLPLHVFGSATYGTRTGRLALVLNGSFAFAPLIFAAVMEGGGIVAGLALALLSSTLAMIFFGLVEWKLRRNPLNPVSRRCLSPRAML